MHRILLIAMLLLSGSSAFAVDRQAVPAVRLVAAAQTALEAKAADAHVVAHVVSVGHIDDLALPAPGPVVLHAQVQDAWLRARIGVPVHVSIGNRPVTSVMVWFAVTAPTKAMVYSTGSARGTPASGVHARTGAIDLARTHGASMPALDAVAGQRLQRAVAAGDAALPSDFEPIPDVQAQQLVQIAAISGVVHLTTTGHALADGRIGQTIAVLPSGASQPVHARVVSHQAVTIEN